MNKLYKIILIFLIGAVLLAAFTFAAENNNSISLGDVNGDEKITAADALEVLQFSVGKIDRFSAEIDPDVSSSSTSSNGGSMRPSVTLTGISDFVKWIENPELKICTDEDEPAQKYFTTLHKGIQDMFATDRFYSLPKTVPDNWKLTGVRLDTVEIFFEYKDSDENYHVLSYTTRKFTDSDLNYCITTKEFEGEKYYVFSTYIGWVVDGYMYGINNCTEGKELFTAETDITEIIKGISFEKIKLSDLVK